MRVFIAGASGAIGRPLVRRLREAGHEVVGMTRSPAKAEAVRAAGEFHPHVALLDIGLPKLNGYEAARAIREAAWGKNMILIAVTGWGQKEDRRRSEEAGFNAHMVKPVDLAALMNLLDGLVAPI